MTEKEIKKLVLNELESLELQRVGVVGITRNGFNILVEKNHNWTDIRDYIITIRNPYDRVYLTRKGDTRMTKKEMKEIYDKAFDLLYEMEKEYFRHSKALLKQDDVTAEDASIRFEMYLKELKELENEK